MKKLMICVETEDNVVTYLDFTSDLCFFVDLQGLRIEIDQYAVIQKLYPGEPVDNFLISFAFF